VQLLSIQGNVARIGIEAPPDVKVLRDELAKNLPAGAALDSRRAPSAHTLRNMLNKVSLSLSVFQQQWHRGLTEAANATLEKVFATLETLGRDPSALADPKPAAPPALSRFRTLVVEDDSNERELLAGLLSMNGCECETAADGLDALEYLSSHQRPDLVLLDLRMPRCDGPRMLAQIRSNPQYQGLKVFAISGISPEEVGVPQGPAGVDAWFPKPLNARKLCQAIKDSMGVAAGSR
jgi:CheY-like chemotaxis protein/sRNA-binding carbon storage regulator CsrA